MDTMRSQRSRPWPALPTLALLLALSGCGGRPEGLNVVVITLDTTRSDHLSLYGFPAAINPTLDALAKRGIVFDRAYTPMGQTLPAHASLFTGRTPRAHGALENYQELPAHAVTLAEVLGGKGYQTAAFIGALVLDDTTGMAQGFDVYDEPRGKAKDSQHPAERRADAVTDAAIAWTLSGYDEDRPFLLWAHYYDPHGPFEAPSPSVPQAAVRRQLKAHVREFGSEPPVSYLGLRQTYADEIAFTDQQVGRLLDRLQAAGMLTDTVVVVVSDHGEGLMEHGEKGHGVNVFEELMQVPLIVAAPEGSADGALGGTRVEARVLIEDVMPTVLDLAGHGGLSLETDGMNLMPDLRAGREPRERPVFVERPHYSRKRIRWRSSKERSYDYGVMLGVIIGDEKLVREPDGSEALYDLRADPDELTDLSAERPAAVGRLSGLLDEWIMRHPVDKIGVAPELSPERLDALKQLGY
jgi:arylsulfatase A-like enzyme